MPGHRSVIARGLGAEEATRRVADVLGERPGYVVRALAPGRVVVTRSRRPRWAIWLCVLTVWIFGLGLLFLLVRRTEGADLLVVEGPRGAVVTLPPLVADADARAVEDALGGAVAPPDEPTWDRAAAGGERTPGEPDGAAASSHAGDLDAPTVPRPERGSRATRPPQAAGPEE